MLQISLRMPAPLLTKVEAWRRQINTRRRELGAPPVQYSRADAIRYLCERGLAEVERR